MKMLMEEYGAYILAVLTGTGLIAGMWSIIHVVGIVMETFVDGLCGG
ncbi:MAG: hypothetical protein MJ087_05275 [Lachnospiraceae bacterium]|nr:hypothetical protein [Lachnospiraceae bacterium]